MKGIFKLALISLGFSIMAAGLLFYALMHPGLQKSFFQSQLPEGSSVENVRISASAATISGLDIPLEDGTRVQLEIVEADFNPLSALLSRTVRVGELSLEGLVVDIPRPILPSAPADDRVETRSPAERVEPSQHASKDSASASKPNVSEKEKAELADLLFQLEQLDWLIAIDSIFVDGEVRDSIGSVFALRLDAGSFKPGTTTQIDADLRLRSNAELQGGLTEFGAVGRLQLHQKESGGFNGIEVASETYGDDSQGRSLLRVSQSLTLEWDSALNRAAIDAGLNAEILEPGVIRPEFNLLDDLELKADLSAVSESKMIQLKKAQLSAKSKGRSIAEIDLKRPFDLGGELNLEGELIDFTITDLPLAWIQPWLPQEIDLRGSPLAASLGVSGLADGGIAIFARKPISVGPISILQNREAIVSQVTVQMDPKLYYTPGGSIRWEISDLEISDRSGVIIGARTRGSFSPEGLDPSKLIPAGLSTDTSFNIGLSELGRQPILSDKLGPASGRMIGSLSILDGNSPLTFDAALRGLSSRARPGVVKDFAVLAQIQEAANQSLSIEGSFLAGSESQRSTVLELSGRVSPSSMPLRFDLQVSGERVQQDDFDHLAAAFAMPPAQSQSRNVQDSFRSRFGAEPLSQKDSPSMQVPSVAAPPPWASVDGSLDLSVGLATLSSGLSIRDVGLRANVSEPLLAYEASGVLGGAALGSSGNIGYRGETSGYSVEAGANLRDADPKLLGRELGVTLPLEGRFDGDFSATGQGQSLESALKGASGSLSLMGREGRVTAFELGGVSQIGLAGASLLGQTLGRPGIANLAEVVPYFQNLAFDEFVLQLEKREDDRIVIPALRLKGESVLIDGAGSVKVTSFRDLMNQPLTLDLSLGAKGRLTGLLDSLGLLGTGTSQGYRLWNREIQIGGTLGDPDTTVLEGILREASRRALGNFPIGKGPTEPISAQLQGSDEASTKSKEEQLIQDVETGIQLLNSLFGE